MSNDCELKTEHRIVEDEENVTAVCLECGNAYEV